MQVQANGRPYVASNLNFVTVTGNSPSQLISNLSLWRDANKTVNVVDLFYSTPATFPINSRIQKLLIGPTGGGAAVINAVFSWIDTYPDNTILDLFTDEAGVMGILFFDGSAADVNSASYVCFITYYTNIQ